MVCWWVEPETLPLVSCGGYRVDGSSLEARGRASDGGRIGGFAVYRISIGGMSIGGISEREGMESVDAG